MGAGWLAGFVMLGHPLRSRVVEGHMCLYAFHGMSLVASGVCTCFVSVCACVRMGVCTPGPSVRTRNTLQSHTPSFSMGGSSSDQGYE